MYSSTVTLVLLSIVVALANAQCSCQNKPPIDVIYQGEACECGRKYPVQLEVPKITEHRDAHYDYGFTIERPSAPPAEVKYTFDFHMEKPKPLPTASLATYGFEVENPVVKEAEVPKRYVFDYQIQTPVVKSEPSNLQGLVAHVDRVVVQKQDCPGCQCSSYKPTVDLLQRCPKHGHLYRMGGVLNPSNQQRYNKDSSSVLQQVPVEVSTSSVRSKRDAPNAFPIKIHLPGLRPNNQIMKIPSIPSKEDENQSRISEILKKNFGEDPRENIDELLRPKPLGSVQRIQSNLEKNPNENIDEILRPKLIGSVQRIPSQLEKNEETEMVDELKSKTSDFISKIKPRLEEARSNLRSRITEIVNKARLDTIKASHLIHKRSTDSTETDLSNVFLDDAEHFDGSYEPIWVTDTDVADDEPKNESKINDEVANENILSNNDRIRKHCERCGELARKFPCPSCGGMGGSQSIPYAKNILTPTQPRHFYDEFGNRYLENNGKLIRAPQGADVTVGSYHNQPNNAYGELKHILDKNSGTMHSINRRVGEGHLLQPMDFAHTTDAIRYVQELTQHNNHQYNEDYYTNDDSYDVGASSTNYPAKRSFKILPLVKKDDGSLVVKISPTGSITKLSEDELKHELKDSANTKEYSNFQDDVDTKATSNLEENIFNEKKPKANFQKFVRNGRNYEILALSPNGSEEGSVGSAEDMEILKYIYAVNQKELAKENPSTKIIATNTSKNSNTATLVET